MSAIIDSNNQNRRSSSRLNRRQLHSHCNRNVIILYRGKLRLH